MCETCEIAEQLLHDISNAPLDVADAFVPLVNRILPRFRFEDLSAYHHLIGSTPPPHCIHLRVPAIEMFAQDFRSEYLQEI